MLKKLKKAFTITELVIVIAVIAILAAVLIPTFANVIENANQSAALQTSSNALRDYQAIALEDDNSDNDDMAGVVFVSDDYVYTYINSALQYVGKIRDLYYVDASGTIGGDEISETGLTINDDAIVADTKVGNIEFAYTPTDGTVENMPTIAVEDLAVDSDAGKLAENLYFYTVELNSTTYVGWFTMERGEGAAYQTQGANYARQYGYANIDAGAMVITFKAAA